MSTVTLLDGAIGQEIVHRAGKRPTPLWSTSVMIDRPEIVRQVHALYFESGATIATTNTYAVHRDRLEKHGLADRLTELLDTALSEADDGPFDLWFGANCRGSWAHGGFVQTRHLPASRAS